MVAILGAVDVVEDLMDATLPSLLGGNGGFIGVDADVGVDGATVDVLAPVRLGSGGGPGSSET